MGKTAKTAIRALQGTARATRCLVVSMGAVVLVAWLAVVVWVWALRVEDLP